MNLLPKMRGRSWKTLEIVLLFCSASVQCLLSLEPPPSSMRQLRWGTVRIRPRQGIKLYYSSPDKSNISAVSPPRNAVVNKRRRRKRKWNDMIPRLKEFYRQHGHSLVPKGHPDTELYQWTKSLRQNYRHQALGGYDSMSCRRRPWLSDDKLQVLQQLEFPWELQTVVWDSRYEQLCTFRQKHGHCRVPANNLDHPGLGVWVRNQRREFRYLQQGLPSTLTPERLEALESIGFVWYKSHDVAWETRYQELAVFFREYAHTNVPQQHSDNLELGKWCMNQRTAYTRYCDGESTALTAERIEKLEALGFLWNYRQHKWSVMQERLKVYYEQHGHVKIPTSDAVNDDLRIWLILQRYHYNRRKEGFDSPMTDWRIQALEDAIPGFSWKGRETHIPKKKDWAKLFDAMREKGIAAGARPKQHWFDGIDPNTIEVKDFWTEQDLLELWNQEDDDDDYEE